MLVGTLGCVGRVTSHKRSITHYPSSQGCWCLIIVRLFNFLVVGICVMFACLESSYGYEYLLFLI